MSAMKDHLMDIEELVVQALENGFTDAEDVIAFVNTSIVADSDNIITVMEMFQKPIYSIDNLELMC
jgi:hypothetical protein